VFIDWLVELFAGAHWVRDDAAGQGLRAPLASG